jgi:hypothetical protein
MKELESAIQELNNRKALCFGTFQIWRYTLKVETFSFVKSKLEILHQTQRMVESKDNISV